MQSDVVIVGGGLTGCATAYAFAAAGLKVTLLEADRIGRGGTGAASGWIATEPGVPFAQLERTVGLRSARKAWQAGGPPGAPPPPGTQHPTPPPNIITFSAR